MFSAMGTEARLRIIQLLLSAHPAALVVGEIQQELDIPNSALSHQSWLRPSLTIALDPTLPHTVQGAIHQELCVPLRSRNSRTHMSPPGASAARAGRSLVRKLPDPILFSRFVTTPPKRFAQMWPGQPRTAHWGIPDPASRQGTVERIGKTCRDAFFALDRRIRLFISLPLTSLDCLAIRKESRPNRDSMSHSGLSAHSSRN